MSLALLLGAPFRAVWSLYGGVALIAGAAAAVYVGISSKDAATAATLAVVGGALALAGEGLSGALLQWSRERVNSPTARARLSEDEVRTRLVKDYGRQRIGGVLRASVRAGLTGAAAGAGVVGVVRSDATEALTWVALFAIAVTAARTVAAERLSAEKLRAKTRVHRAWSLRSTADPWDEDESRVRKAREDAIATRF